jgi:hypothetical protein
LSVPQIRRAARAAPAAPALADAGLTVVSSGGNHCLDFGHAALADTVAWLTEACACVAGACACAGPPLIFRADDPAARELDASA